MTEFLFNREREGKKIVWMFVLGSNKNKPALNISKLKGKSSLPSLFIETIRKSQFIKKTSDEDNFVLASKSLTWEEELFGKLDHLMTE